MGKRTHPNGKGDDRLQAAVEIGQIGGKFFGSIGGHIDQKWLKRGRRNNFDAVAVDRPFDQVEKRRGPPASRSTVFGSEGRSSR